MNRPPIFLLIGLLSCVVLTTGCWNYNRQCGSYPGYACSPTIAPPATYSLNIPAANGQVAQAPYYTPGNPNATASLPGYLVDPNRRAPVPAGTPNVNQQNGWRPIGGTNLSAVPARQPVNQPAAFASPTTITAGNIQTNNGQRVAAASAPIARSVVTSIDYATTQGDERRDATRLPTTDASNVRAPAGFVNNGTATRLAQVPAAPNYPTTYNQSAVYGQAAAPVFRGTPVIARQPLGGQPVFQGTPVIRQSAPTVLAQSTVQGNPSTTGGWTDRELTASRQGINR